MWWNLVLLNCCSIGFGETFEGLDKTKTSKLITSIANNGNSISFEALEIVSTDFHFTVWTFSSTNHGCGREGSDYDD